MPHFLKIEKVEFSQILATNQLVNIKFKEASLPDLPNNWTDFGEIPVFPDGTFLQPLHITNGIEPGNSYTVRATPQGALTGKDKTFAYAQTTVAPTTVAPTTVAPTTLPPTTVAPTTVPPTTLAPTTVAPTTEAPTTVAPTTTEPPTTAPPTTVEPTTTVAPTTVAPTTIPATTTLPPVPTVSLGAPVCRIGNCNDNAACTVRYAINTTNAPVGSYLAIVQTSGDGTVGMVDTNPASGVFSRSEATGLELETFFTLQLKDSGGIVIATYDGSIGHESFWQYLATCPA